MLENVRHLYDDVLELGAQNGYRDAQVAYRAHRHRLHDGLRYDGVEPDIALIKYKKLVGEGYLKIVNQTVHPQDWAIHRPRSRRSSPTSSAEQDDVEEGPPVSSRRWWRVFDCAFKPVNGERSIHYMGHVRMMAFSRYLRCDQQDRRRARGRDSRPRRSRPST